MYIIFGLGVPDYSNIVIEKVRFITYRSIKMKNNRTIIKMSSFGDNIVIGLIRRQEINKIVRCLLNITCQFEPFCPTTLWPSNELPQRKMCDKRNSCGTGWCFEIILRVENYLLQPSWCHVVLGGM